MRKRGARSALVAAAFAVVLVSAAPAAAATFTMPSGTRIPNGTATKTTSSNTKVKTSSLGTVTCEMVTKETKVTKNSESGSELVGVGEGTASGCKAGSTSITVKNLKVTSWTGTGEGKGSLVFSFSAVFPSFTCTYSSQLGGTPVTFANGGTSFKVSGSLTVSPAACGTASFEADETLETATAPGGLVEIDWF